MDSKQIQNSTITLPLSAEQQAVLDAASGAAPRRRGCLLQTDEPLDATRFTAAMNDALRSHEWMQYRIGTVEGFRTPRLCRTTAAMTAVLESGGLSLADGDDAMQAVAAWARGLPGTEIGQQRDADSECVLRIAPLGPRQMALAFDPLLLDPGSITVLIRQAFGLLKGEALNSANFEYSQYIEWRRELEHSGAAEAGQAYWTAHLGEDSAWLAPRLCYRECNAKTSFNRMRAARRVSVRQFEALTRLAEQHDTSVEVLLQSLWWLLLARLMGTSKYLAGWRHDCRADYEMMAESVGVFEKTLPVVVDVQSDRTLAQWLAHFAAMAHMHVEQQEYWPLVDAPVRAHHAVGFVAAPGLQDGNPGGWQLLAAPEGASEFELALHVVPVVDAIEWSVLADPACYPPQAAQRLVWQFSALLATALDDPNQRVEDLDLVSDEERPCLLAINPASQDFGAQSVLQSVVQWASETPDAPALQGEKEPISYRQLLTDVRRKAHWLRKLGVMPGSLVAVALPRSTELVTTLLAVWQAGGGYLPIEPDWPAPRRLAVLEDAQPALLVHDSLSDEANTKSWRDAALDPAAWQAYPDTPIQASDPAPQDLAYVLYTSGSTGKPKGVAIRHAQLSNYVAAVSHALQLQQPRRWALVNTVAADLGNTALFGALFNGACLIVAQPRDVSDAEAFGRFIETRKIDAIKIVPSHLEALLESDHAQLPHTIILGGEAAPRSLLERIREVCAHSVIHNHYGPTETTVGVMVHTLGASEALPAALPLTQVLGNNRVYVLDASMRLVPAGARGEVYVGGAQVCQGYLNRAAGEDFLTDPFEPGARLYRSRDLAYVLPQGGIRLAGRSDEQIKVRGFRVNPAEVESILQALPGVRQAVVMALGDDHGACELGAFVVATQDIDPQTIKASLQARLPGHMVPARITLFDDFPRLPNGKVDRQSIRQLTTSMGSAAAPSQDPLTREVAKIMAELLQRDLLGPDEDFFDLGAHSLMAIKLVARLRRQLNVEIAPAMVFDHTTPVALATALRDMLDKEAAAASSTVPS